jgi:transposase
VRRIAGIDVGSETHVIAVVDENGGVLHKATAFGEDAAGYRRVRKLLGGREDLLVAMEATGVYWRNLFAALVADGFSVTLVNPLRTSRFAEEELARTKTDAIDALGIARFAAQKRPAPTQVPDEAIQDLREMVRLRLRILLDQGDCLRRLHRVLRMTFPEFTRCVRTLESELATALLSRYPSAQAFNTVRVKTLSRLCYDGHRHVGEDLAGALIKAAKVSVGRFHSEPYRLQIKYLCADIALSRVRIKDLEREIERKLEEHEVGKLLTTIDGIGTQTAARLLGELGDPARFRSSAALASYVGVIPRVRQSGKRTSSGGPRIPLGNALLRRALWMPTLTAIRLNPWLRAHYQRLLAAHKAPKEALVAVMRKLLTAVYSVAKNRRPFVPRLNAPALSPPPGGGAVNIFK